VKDKKDKAPRYDDDIAGITEYLVEEGLLQIFPVESEASKYPCRSASG
jgi:hypothetical protein